MWEQLMSMFTTESIVEGFPMLLLNLVFTVADRGFYRPMVNCDIDELANVYLQNTCWA
jgi:hypothetical protein